MLTNDRSGQVFLLVDDADGGFPLELSVSGYWDAMADGPDSVRDELLPGGTIREAIRWARARCDEVVIRSHNPLVDAPVAVNFWAGTGPAPAGMGVWPVPEDLES